MKKCFFLLLLSGLLMSCGAHKGIKSGKKGPEYSKNKRDILGNPIYADSLLIDSTGNVIKLLPQKEPSKEAEKVVNYAMGFLGTKYKWGGMTKKGMDCSGLIYISFINAVNIFLPRTSRGMAKQGCRILKSEVQIGDLLFFETNPRRKRINHVGLVVSVDAKGIHFISATTHGGVMVSDLQQRYWKNTFVEARRIL